MIRRYLSLREVAARLGVGSKWLYANRARLTREHGFPPAALGMRYRWDEAAIAVWQDRLLQAGGIAPPAAAPPAEPPVENDDECLAAWRAELDRRAVELCGA